MILNIITKNKAKELVKEEIIKQLKEVWEEFDRINSELILIKEDIKILYDGNR